jgi:hypothetical protein
MIGMTLGGLKTLEQGIGIDVGEAEDIYFTKRAIRVVLEAIIASNSQPKELGILIGRSEPRSIRISNFDLPAMLAAQVKSHFTHLEHLNLIAGSTKRDDENEDIDPEDLAPNYNRFLKLFPQISRFTANFGRRANKYSWCYGEGGYFPALSSTLDLPNLRVLKICCATCKTETVLRLLRRHVSLKKLYLQHIDLSGGKEAWQTFLHSI